jgi:Tol biopolymer transport system component
MRTVVVVALSLLFSGALQAQSIDSGKRAPDPAFVRGQIQSQRSIEHAALADVERSGEAIWDPSSQAWFASANGTIVRIAEEGGLLVVAHGVQGHDIDVRLSAGLAVSREPNDRIVLHRVGQQHAPGTLLLEGPNFFHPRLSPDGKQVLVHESRAAGSRLWLVASDSGEARILSEGVAAVWHPDGLRVVFARVTHDSRRILGSTLYEIRVATGATRVLRTPANLLAVEPAVSPDGSQLAFVAATTDRLFTVSYPEAGEEVGHER